MEQLDLVRELIKLMKEHGLSSLKCGGVELVAGSAKVFSGTATNSPTTKVPELTPEQILGLDHKDLAELITWSSGGDAESVSKMLAPRK